MSQKNNDRLRQQRLDARHRRELFIADFREHLAAKKRKRLRKAMRKRERDHEIMQKALGLFLLTNLPDLHGWELRFSHSDSNDLMEFSIPLTGD